MSSTKFTTWDGEERTAWSAGAWKMLQRGDEIADITYADVPVLRALRFVIRDQDWRTPEARIRSVTMLEDRFTIDAQYRLDDIDVAARLLLTVSGDVLTFTVDATSRTAFWTQRTGLVAQQPPQLAGTDFTIVHPDGATTATTFPDAVRPHQPAKAITELLWETQQLPIRMRFDGGVFEMEDQRNWTDASYKTYTPPLADPAPVQTTIGQTWRQSITVTTTPNAAITPTRAVESDRIELVRSGRSAPAIGVAASSAPDDGHTHPAPPAQFLLVELLPDTPNWRDVLTRASAAGLPLDVRIVTDKPAAIKAAVDAIRAHPLVRVGVFARSTHVTEPGLWQELETLVEAYRLNVELVGGARTHYTELNRTHRRIPAFPSYTFSVTPQMHVHETAQLVESIPMQQLITRDARWIAAGMPVHVGPVTLRARVNAVATTQPPTEAPDLHNGFGPNHVPGSTDPRQTAPALGAWTVASAAAIAAAGAASVTFFEGWGPRGLEGTDGQPFPVRAAVQVLAELAGSPLLVQPKTDTATRVWAIGVERGADRTVVVANLTDAARRVDVRLGMMGTSVDVPAWGWRVSVF